MDSKDQALIAFSLTGKRTAAHVEPIKDQGLKPALFARYRNLSELRYDYPVVLLPTGYESLSKRVDRAIEVGATGGDPARVRKHAYQIEKGVRRLLASGQKGSLSKLWATAASQVKAKAEEGFDDSAKRVGQALRPDGELLDCSPDVARTLFSHAWSVAQDKKAAAYRDRAERLLLRLKDILKADLVSSVAGRTPENLAQGFGSSQTDMFDFAAMSNLLVRTTPETTLSESRRKRIEWLVSVLEYQRFFQSDRASGAAPYSFEFETCHKALKAYQERAAEAIELAKALAMAELEAYGDYRESVHDALFAGYGARGLDAQDLKVFPDYYVFERADRLDGNETEAVLQALASGVPIKVIVQVDDLWDPTSLGDGMLGLSSKTRRLAHSAMSLGDVFVFQSPASHLVATEPALSKGMSSTNGGLFLVYSGTGGVTEGVPPYLVAAAAAESRAFPVFSYDPTEGSELADRFDVAANPQADSGWPAHTVSFEGPNMQRLEEPGAFTLVDFAAMDGRLSDHFSTVPTDSGCLAPVPEFLDKTFAVVPDSVPSIPMVDEQNRFVRVIADDWVIRETKRCQGWWRNLQEWGGISNSYADRAIKAERQHWEAKLAEAKQSATPSASAAPAAVVESAPEPVAAEAAPAAVVEEKPSDDPYIETERCTTCNECTLLNNQMFGYNENKQAYIKDPDAGTFRQLVEAAEGCQVGIIHPGKPRNPKEPGLEELIERAKPFA